MLDEKPKFRRTKVDHACVYCRRSHMTCDSKRPCQRCIKRNIGHLCHDEGKKSPGAAVANADGPDSANTSGAVSDAGASAAPPPSFANQNSNFNPVFISEHAGSEFSSLNDFMTMFDDNPNMDFNDFVGGAGAAAPAIDAAGEGASLDAANGSMMTAVSDALSADAGSNARAASHERQKASADPESRDSARDRFFLTAADPSEDMSPEERLKQVIYAKLEAGLLQPFNYVNGYTRLQKYMDNYMNASSKARIVKPLSVFRPAFRAIAQSLKDVDLVLVEEAFERMLLDYDRVFTSMAIPACLWRRTGEIYRGNKEFAALVEVSVEDLRDGKLAIYELMSEESAVNYWEKYGSIAFDAGQKAVLTSCNLRTRDGRKRRACCFSFTIQRDRYNIPSCIVGNFIPIHP